MDIRTRANNCPENKASCLSRISFSWPGRLLELGSKKILTSEDVPDLCPACECMTSYPVFENEWDKELTKLSGKNTSHIEDAKESIYHQLYDKSDIPTNPRKHALAWALLKTFKWRFVMIQFLQLLCFFLLWIAPLHLRTLIAYVEKPWGGLMQGGMLVASLFVSQGLDSIVYQQFIYMRNKLQTSTQIILMTAIYKKCLRLSNSGRKHYPVGKMLTLVSTDAAEAGLAFNNVSFSFLSPLNIVVVFIQLFLLIGPASSLSLIASLVLVLTHIHIARRMHELLKLFMEKQDRRMKLLSEVLTGIKAIKLHAWESCFGERITRRRDEELKVLSDVFCLKIPLVLSTTVAPFMVSALTLAMYVLWYDHAYLDASLIFSTVSLLKILRRGLNMTPDFFHDLARLQTHVDRIEAFLLQDEQATQEKNDINIDTAIEIKDATFSWEKTASPVLKNISMKVATGGLVAVVGQVGCGKSALIHALLNELVTIDGAMQIQGSVAYVPQQAFVQNDTLQKNILFGNVMYNEWYYAVFDACAMTLDVDALPGGDLTEIGEKGVNLSGGQKQRVSLARAVYNDADIYLLDDPLSAVDSHVGKHIFDRVISNKGLLKDKTRVLVTHNVSVLPRVDSIIVMSEGSVDDMGTYQELISRSVLFRNVVSSSPLTSMEHDPFDEVYNDSISQENNLTENVEKRVLGKLMSEENMSLGGIKAEVITKLVRVFGYWHWVVIMGLYLLYYVTVSLANIWLSVWAEESMAQRPLCTAVTPQYNSTPWFNTTHPQYNTCQQPEKLSRAHSDSWYTSVYFCLGVLQAVVVLAYSIALKTFTVSASKKVHTLMLQRVLLSPIKFFETTPLGRITNRFSQDINIVDKDLPFTLEIWMDSCFQTLCSMCIVFYSAPGVIVILIPIFYCCVVLQKYFISTSRQLKRAYVTSLSRVLSFFSETCQGVEVIRAYGEQKRFTCHFIQLIESYQKFNYYNFIVNRWLSIRLSFVCHVVLASTAMLIFLQGGAVNSGIMGLALSFAYETSNDLRMFVIRSTKLDIMSISMEKIMSYIALQVEDAEEHTKGEVPRTWPSQGDVRFTNLSVRYRPGLPLALRGVNLTIKPGEKVGVVGRTGAGKSSLILSLFRLIEPQEGAIVIDDVNISDVSLPDLRSRMTIIPQDPILLCETLRVNLDPMEAYSDEEVWAALGHAHLLPLVKSLPGQLAYRCQEGGKNFSIGQRQLLCLARTLLRKSKILVLDEATAAVDMETDDLIQQTIRSEFKDCTVLTIAHRLNTVMDYDRIVLMNKGSVDACDSPDKLLQNKTGLFYILAKNAGIA